MEEEEEEEDEETAFRHPLHADTRTELFKKEKGNKKRTKIPEVDTR
jgi:hypothetical protein